MLAFVAMFLVGMALQAPVPTDWDAWDYSAQAIRGHSSDLLLGRWWFIATMRAAFLIASGITDISIPDAYGVMQAVNGVFMAAAVAVGMAWTGRLTRSVTAEVVFAALAITGPTFGVYTMSIMTEPMTLLLLATAFWAWQRGVESDRHGLRWALLAGAALGIVADIREPAALLCAWPIVSCLVQKPRRRWPMLGVAVAAGAVTLGVGIAMAWQWYPVAYTGRTYWQNMQSWTADMARERSQFAVRPLHQLWVVLQYSVAASPVTTVLAVPAIVWGFARRRTAAWLAAGAGPYFVTLLLNHDMSVNPRFMLPLLWTLLPLVSLAVAEVAAAGASLWSRRSVAAVAGVVLLGGGAFAAGWPALARFHFGYVDSMTKMYVAMSRIRPDALIVAGPGTPIVYHFKRLGLKQFEVVGSGWGWPDSAEALRARIAQAKSREGGFRPVWINDDRATWDLVNRDSGEFDMLQEAVAPWEKVSPPGYEPMAVLVEAGRGEPEGEDPPPPAAIGPAE